MKQPNSRLIRLSEEEATLENWLGRVVCSILYFQKMMRMFLISLIKAVK